MTWRAGYLEPEETWNKGGAQQSEKRFLLSLSFPFSTHLVLLSFLILLLGALSAASAQFFFGVHKVPRVLDQQSRSRFHIRLWAIPISGRRQMSYEVSLSLIFCIRLVFLLPQQNDFNSWDLVLLLCRMALDLKHKRTREIIFSSDRFLLLMLLLLLWLGSFLLLCISSFGAHNMSASICCLHFDCCCLSPGEDDGKLRNGFQQWWIAPRL